MLDTVSNQNSVEGMMLDIGRRARAAARPLAMASTEAKNRALLAMADAVMEAEAEILAANTIDLKNAAESGVAASFIDRLTLNSARVTAIAQSMREIAELPDPVGTVITEWDRPNGLHIERVRTPLGVIGVIYESRPNVTADAGALCLKAGNAVILRGGSDSANSSRAIHACLVKGLVSAGLPADAIQLVPTTDRAAVGALLSGLEGSIDVIVPRGGKSLVARVQQEARVPVFAHLEGLCHVYVDGSADLNMAKKIVVNAKMRRVGVCGSTETMLIDASVAPALLPRLAKALEATGCELRGDERARAIHPMIAATAEDWTTEYLAPILSIAVVDGIDGAMAHIARYGSQHTESIITEDRSAAERFTSEVDSAIVMHNASTQFADGAEFGMGAEIGIATGRLHARGPVGAEQLTIFKYVVRGEGQIRP